MIFLLSFLPPPHPPIHPFFRTIFDSYILSPQYNQVLLQEAWRAAAHEVTKSQT